MINQFFLNLNISEPEQIENQAIEINYLPCISKIRLIGRWQSEHGRQKTEDENLNSENEKK